MKRFMCSLLFLAFILTACGKNDISGRYQLVSINGANVPTITVLGKKIGEKVISGELILNADGSCIRTEISESTINNDLHLQGQTNILCQYTREDNTLLFKWRQEGKIVGDSKALLDGNIITLDILGILTLVYQK